jgi:2-C-methyl-D-erythritol 4-phosphate cytidylyltransferase
VTAQQSVRGDVAILVVAAGSGVRLGSGTPKALRLLRGESLLVHAVRRGVQAVSVGQVVVAAPPDSVESVAELLAPVLAHLSRPSNARLVTLNVIAGGASRHASVAMALSAVAQEYRIVLVHDAARALTPPDLVESVAAAVRAGRDAVVPVLPVVDTIKQVDLTGLVTGTVDRSSLRAVQTPQGFRRDVLDVAHQAQTRHTPAAARLTDDAGLVESMGVAVWTVPGSEMAFKITRPLDLALAERLLELE